MWTCQRQKNHVVCRHVNSNRKQLCERCGGRRAKRRRPKHLVALELSYQDFIELNGGEFCAICGRDPSSLRRLDRDHDHRTGEPRGLLCWACNSQLRGWMTADWLRKAAAYLDRS